jgi:hypothetical protein
MQDVLPVIRQNELRSAITGRYCSCVILISSWEKFSLVTSTTVIMVLCECILALKIRLYGERSTKRP